MAGQSQALAMSDLVPQ